MPCKIRHCKSPAFLVNGGLYNMLQTDLQIYTSVLTSNVLSKDYLSFFQVFLCLNIWHMPYKRLAIITVQCQPTWESNFNQGPSGSVLFI